MTVIEARKVQLFFQFDTAAGAANSFRVGSLSQPYILDTNNDFFRAFCGYVLIQLPTVEVVPSGGGTVVSSYGAGYLRINQGDSDEFVYTIKYGNYYTNGSVRIIELSVDPAGVEDVRANPPLS